MFGRTVDQVLSSLVRWEVPGSSEVLMVHERALPAFERAADNLEAALQAGEAYRIDRRSTFAVAARTIGDNWRWRFRKEDLGRAQMDAVAAWVDEGGRGG